MGMPDPRPTFAYLATALRDAHPKLAYLHVVEPRVAGAADRVVIEGENNDFLRAIWKGGESGEERAFIAAGGYTRETALRTADEKGGLVAFGRLYIANVRVTVHFRAGDVCSSIYRLEQQPDLPIRLQKNLTLTRPDRSTYYLRGNLTPLGYSDWPFADGPAIGVEGKL